MQYLPGTLIPAAFATSESVGCSSAGSTSRPLPAYKSLPKHLCGAGTDLMSDRPSTLPEGFSLFPTPKDSEISTFSSAVNSSWKSNLYILKMGPAYAPIIGRALRLVDKPTTLAFEIMYASYSISFEQSMLDAPGVQFYPAFLGLHSSGDINFYAKQNQDMFQMQNVIPSAPPGAYLAFGRMSGRMAVKPSRTAGLYSSVQDHPVVNGARLFPSDLLSEPAKKKKKNGKPAGCMQEGGIGFLVFRPNYDHFGLEPERCRGAGGRVGGQLTQLYFRCAFGPEALGSVEAQATIVRDALAYAIGNSPRDDAGQPFISVVHTMEPVLVPSTSVAEACEAFETHRVVNSADVDVVIKWLLAVNICRENRDMPWDAAFMEAGFQMSVGVYMDALTLTSAEVEAVSVEMSGTVSGVTKFEAVQTVMHSNDQRMYSADEVRVVYETYCTARQKALVRHAASHCSPVMVYTAPPDTEKFAGRPVVVFGVLLSIRLGLTTMDTLTPYERRLCRRIAGDIGTRVMCDAMLFNPVLAVTPCASECMLSLFTDKAPGLLNVRSACTGTPIKATSTSDHRRIRNAHPAILGLEIFTTEMDVPALPSAAVPEMTREQADRNPFLQALIRGGNTPYAVPGVEVSIYDSTHTCQTIVAGTRHSWSVKGAILYHRIMTPRSKDYPLGFFDASVTDVQREEAVQFLFPPDYNSTACQIYSETGAWSKEGTTHRPWRKPYAVDVAVLHSAMWWWYTYPAFLADKTHPSAIDIWTLKTRAEAEVHWMGRWGRIIRQLLNKRRRQIRSDYAQAVFRNYYCALKRVPDAPIMDMVLSAINVFKDTLILGEQQLSAKPDDEREGVVLDSDSEDEEDDDEGEFEEDCVDFDRSLKAFDCVDALDMMYGGDDILEMTTAKTCTSEPLRKRACF